MKKLKVWGILLTVVTVTSMSALAGAKGVTPGNAPSASGSGGEEETYCEPPHLVEVIKPIKTLVLADGTVEQYHSKEVTQLDGITKINYNTKITTHTDGSKEKQESSGIDYSDGTKTTRVQNADGSYTDTYITTLKQADGSVWNKTSSVTKWPDKREVLSATATVTTPDGTVLNTQTERTTAADGSSQTIETVTDASGKCIEKRSEERKADQTVIVTIDGVNGAMTLQGVAGAQPALCMIGKAPASLPETVIVNGTTYRVIPAAS